MAKLKKKPEIGESNWKKCTCPWHLGMGPELHCPVHGNLAARKRTLLSLLGEVFYWLGMPEVKRQKNGCRLRLISGRICRTLSLGGKH